MDHGSTGKATHDGNAWLQDSDDSSEEHENSSLLLSRERPSADHAAKTAYEKDLDSLLKNESESMANLVIDNVALLVIADAEKLLLAA